MLRGPSSLRVYLFLALSALLLFGGCVRMFFLQDDFYFLAQARTPCEIAWKEAFSLQTGYFRPLTQRILPAFQVWMFGYHPVPHHLLSLALFIVNACLLCRLLETILKSRGLALMGSFFYLTRSAHFLSLYWVSASAESWMFLFFLLALITFLRAGTDGGRPRRKWLAMSVLFYGLSLLSKETVFLAPILLFLWAGLFPSLRPDAPRRARFSWRQAWRMTWPHIGILALYLVVRIGVGGLGAHGVYLMSKPANLIVNALAYAAMIVDVNREVIRQVYLGEPSVSFGLMAMYGLSLLSLWVVLPAIVGGLCVRSGRPYPAFLARRGRSVVFALAWMGLSAIPLAAMTLGFYGYYMTPFLGGLALLVALHGEYLGETMTARMSEGRARGLAIAFLILLFLTSFLSIRIEEGSSHGSFQRAKTVRGILDRLRREVPPPPDGSAIEFTGLNRKQFWDLGWGYSLFPVYGSRGYRFYTRDGDENSPDRIPPGPYTELRLVDGRFVAFQRIRESKAQPDLPPEAKPGTSTGDRSGS